VNDKKAVYIAPELTVHGDLVEVTQQNTICSFQDALGQVPPVVGSEFSPPICT
jgi:hypothetical protein